ncbi:MAG: CBS domain-containing protein [Pseudomonadota bacterium]
MNVGQILKDKGRRVVVNEAAATIDEIVKELAEKKIGAVVIVDEVGKVAGIVSERDVMRSLAQNGASTLAQSAASIMTRDVVTCREGDSVNRIMEAMTAGRFRHVPVVGDDLRLTGIVSIGDVVKNHIAEVELEASALKSYVAG